MGMYSDPCDECLMECDHMIDWEGIELMSHEYQEEVYVEYEMCTDTCYDMQHGACRGLWHDVMHPCDACLMGCHASEELPWLDEEIAMGPFSPGRSANARW